MWSRKIIKFFTHDLWNSEATEKTLFRGVYYKSLRIIYLAGKGFVKDNCMLKASALTYFSILSIVPVLAMAFGIAQGFGFGTAWIEWIRENLGAQPEVVEAIIGFVENLLSNVNSGVIAGTGMVFLIWTVLQLMNNIEESLNSIFGINRPRTWLRKFTDYLTIVIFAPVLIFLSTGITVFFTRQIEALVALLEIEKFVLPLVGFAAQLIPYLLIWMMLTLVYMILPNLKVKFSSALVAGIFAGALYQLTQWVYISFQIGVSRYGTIYSTFAALPLFMIWLQVSWFIFLFGAEIASAHQNLEKYMSEKEKVILSFKQRKLLSLLVLKVIIRQFKQGEPPLTVQEISSLINIPDNYVSHILYSLMKVKLLYVTLNENQIESYLPSQDIERYNVSLVYEYLENENYIEKWFLNTDNTNQMHGIMADLDKTLSGAPGNLKIKDM